MPSTPSLRIEPHGVVGFRGDSRCLVAALDGSDGSSIAGRVELRHGVFGEVAAFAGLPFVVHVAQDGADEADDGRLVREDADDSGLAFKDLPSAAAAFDAALAKITA